MRPPRWSARWCLHNHTDPDNSGKGKKKLISNSPRWELWNQNKIFWHNCERTEVDLPKGAAPQFAADAEPVADARLHGCGGSCGRSRVGGDDPGNQQKQTNPAMRESNGFSLMLWGDSGLGLEWIEVGGDWGFLLSFFSPFVLQVSLFSRARPGCLAKRRNY